MPSTTLFHESMQRVHRFGGADVPGAVEVFNPDRNRTADYEVAHFQHGHAGFVEIVRLAAGETKRHELFPEGAEIANNGRTDLVVTWEG
jgi:hypothetical protein